MPDLTRREVDLRRLARTLTGAGTLPSLPGRHEKHTEQRGWVY